ncbi:MAG: barstar family protein [Lachnospiraceae bacterium]
MKQNDLMGIWNANPEYKRNILSGMRPIFQIMDEYMTTGIIECENTLNDGDIVQVKLISPKYYANSVWQGKDIEVFDGSRRMGTISVEQIINPILDIDKEKWVLIDGRDINTLDDFFDVINEKLTDRSNASIGRNLNAFNDLLWGGFGVHEYNEPLNIVWIFSEISKERLGTDFKQILEIISQHESGKIKIELYKEHAFE